MKFFKVQKEVGEESSFIILVDQFNDTLPKILDVAERLGAKIPEELWQDYNVRFLFLKEIKRGEDKMFIYFFIGKFCSLYIKQRKQKGFNYTLPEIFRNRRMS